MDIYNSIARENWVSVLRVKFCVSVVNKNIFSWKYRLGSSEWWAFISHWRCVWICTYDGRWIWIGWWLCGRGGRKRCIISSIFKIMRKSWKGVVKKEREIKYIYCCCIKKKKYSFASTLFYLAGIICAYRKYTNRIKKCFAGIFWF